MGAGIAAYAAGSAVASTVERDRYCNQDPKVLSDLGRLVITEGKTPQPIKYQVLENGALRDKLSVPTIDNLGQGRVVTNVMTGAADAACVNLQHVGGGRLRVDFPDHGVANGYPVATSLGVPTIEVRDNSGGIAYKVRDDYF